MTPFGHLGGGILVAGLVEKVVLKNQISPTTLGVAILLSILPDLDSFPAALLGKWKPGQQKLDHHDYVTHTPLFYILLSILIWIGLGEELAILFISVTLTHLLLDSWATDDGIMWLWPLRKKKYSILPSNLHEGGLYGVRYYLRYATHLQVSIPELILFVGGMWMVFVVMK